MAFSSHVVTFFVLLTAAHAPVVPLRAAEHLSSDGHADLQIDMHVQHSRGLQPDGKQDGRCRHLDRRGLLHTLAFNTCARFDAGWLVV